jgi:MoaA/NifB/PqqE/SkfB family radical SAM enzyme
MKMLYTRMKVFHYADKLDSLMHGVSNVLPPVHIRIKPTNICCHRCRYCAYRTENLQLGKDMNERDSIPRDKMLDIADDIIEMGVKAVTFSGGGEPFCYPHLLEVVQRLAASPVRFAALTNGVRVTGEIAEFFARHATWLRVSIDGWDGASYARYRGVSDREFDKVLANLRRFRQYNGRCYTGASIIVDRDNAGHVCELIGKLRDTGIHSVKIAPCIVSNDGPENNEYHAPIFDQVKDEVARAAEIFAGSEFEIFDSYHRQLDSFGKQYTWCPYLQILPVIGADQNVYSCHDKAYNLDSGLLGSVRDRRFKDFWLEGKDKFLAINPSRDCNHHCEADSKNRMLLEYLQADTEHLAFV